MTVVYVIGKSTDRALEELILSQLTKSYRVTYVKNKSLVQAGQGYEILVADSTEIKSLYIPECIIILKNDATVPKIPLPEKSIIIVNSECTHQLMDLKNSGLNVVTCGSCGGSASEKDTLCYSSLTSDSIVISLNREIVAFSGRAVQPLEIPLKLDKMPKDVYYPIAFTALRLILDDYNSDLGELI